MVVALGCGPTVASDATNGDASTGEPTTGSATLTSATTTTEPGTSVGTSIGTSADESTTTTGGSDDDDSSSDGRSFIMEPDGGGVLCSTLSICDVWSQDCPDGEKCVVFDGDGAPYLEGCVSFRCSPLAVDPVPPGDTCHIEDGPWSGLDDCEIGAFCWDVDPDTLEGTCVGNCQNSEADPLCDDGLTCFHGYDGAITACVPGCDALAPECGDAAVCATTDGAPSVCLPESLPIPIDQSTTCEHDVGCGDGFACIDAERVPGCEDPGSCCTRLCDPAAPACEGEASVCTPLGANPSVGACTLE